MLLVDYVYVSFMEFDDGLKKSETTSVLLLQTVLTSKST